jgi:UDP-glucose 4-epimerase
MSGFLVTGATTPIGRQLVADLLQLRPERSVIAVGVEPRPRAFGELDGSRFHYHQVDLTHGRAAHDLMFGPVRDHGVDVVIHTALHRKIHDRDQRIHALNVGTTRELLSLSERQPNIRRFVFRSHAGVYRIDPTRTTLLCEDDLLELSPSAPPVVRQRVEADLTVCARMGMSRLGIVVLRCSEILTADVGSQLHDYLSSRVCFRPLGFDPMLNLLSLEDAARAVVLAAESNTSGIFNIDGADTLPLSRAIQLSGRHEVPLPGPLLAPLYRARASMLRMEFSYDTNHRVFHFSSVLDARRAHEALGYQPRHPIRWPRSGMQLAEPCP